MAGETPLNRVEFYKRGGGLIDTCRSAAVPRQGEYINPGDQLDAGFQGHLVHALNVYASCQA